MQFEVMYSKIHRARVTGANLNYTGSITIDKALAREAGMFENIKVDVLNLHNGVRFSTYVILGENQGEITLNGACARKAQVGDLIIIVSYALLDFKEAQEFKPKIVHVDSYNQIYKPDSQ